MSNFTDNAIGQEKTQRIALNDSWPTERLVDDWIGILMIDNVSIDIGGSLYAPTTVDICQYLPGGSSGLKGLNAKLRFDSSKFPPPEPGSNAFKALSFKNLHSEIQRCAIESGFEIVSRGVGRVFCKCARLSSTSSDKYQSKNMRKRIPTLPVDPSKVCTFKFKINCDEKGYYVNTAHGVAVHKHHPKQEIYANVKSNHSRILSLAQIEKRIQEDIPLWTVNQNCKFSTNNSTSTTPTTQNDSNYYSIQREFVTKNFQCAIDCINAIAIIAEQQQHHPNLHLTNYREIRIELYSHTLFGITRNDILLAQLIDTKVKIDYSPKWLQNHPEAIRTSKNNTSNNDI